MFPPRNELFFAPTEPAAATTQTTTPAPEPVATPQPSAAIPVSPQPQGDISTPAVPQTPSPPSWLEGLKKHGVNFSETDEAKVLEQIAQSWKDAEQLRPLAPYATQYMQRAGDFQRFLAQQQPQPQPQQQDWTAQLGWNPPPFDPRWEQMVTRDAQGNLVPVPGAPIDIVPKYQAYAQFRKETADALLSNPGKFMLPYIHAVATQVAQQYASQNVGGYREEVQAQQFVAENAPWLYEKGVDGGIKQAQVFNPNTGRHEYTKVLSEWGNLFRDKVVEYANAGFNVGQQKDFALRDVRLAYAMTQLGQQTPAAAPAPAANPQSARETANAAFTNARNPAGTRPGGNATVPKTPVTKGNLEQIMAQRFKENGVSVT